MSQDSTQVELIGLGVAKFFQSSPHMLAGLMDLLDIPFGQPIRVMGLAQGGHCYGACMFKRPGSPIAYCHEFRARNYMDENQSTYISIK